MRIFSHNSKKNSSLFTVFLLALLLFFFFFFSNSACNCYGISLSSCTKTTVTSSDDFQFLRCTHSRRSPPTSCKFSQDDVKVIWCALVLLWILEFACSFFFLSVKGEHQRALVVPVVWASELASCLGRVYHLVKIARCSTKKPSKTRLTFNLCDTGADSMCSPDERSRYLADAASSRSPPPCPFREINLFLFHWGDGCKVAS